MYVPPFLYALMKNTQLNHAPSGLTGSQTIPSFRRRAHLNRLQSDYHENRWSNHSVDMRTRFQPGCHGLLLGESQLRNGRQRQNKGRRQPEQVFWRDVGRRDSVHPGSRRFRQWQLQVCRRQLHRDDN